MDYRIEKTAGQWDVALVDGDIVLLDDESDADRIEAVSQRAVYRFMTWLGESPYEVTAGVPHDAILGSTEPVEGVVGLYALEIGDTEGVSAVEDLSFVETSGELEITATIRIGDVETTVVGAVS